MDPGMFRDFRKSIKNSTLDGRVRTTIEQNMVERGGRSRINSLSRNEQERRVVESLTLVVSDCPEWILRRVTVLMIRVLLSYRNVVARRHLYESFKAISLDILTAICFRYDV